MLTFGNGGLDSILRQLTVSFSPSHTTTKLPIDSLSDGQKSLFYFSVVLAWISLTQEVINNNINGIDPTLLNPPLHTIFAVEEPENSLAPYYLGRIVKQLQKASKSCKVQSVIATHTPTLLKRVEPTAIRFLRLDHYRQTLVQNIELPEPDAEAAKYVNEAVKAYPELYFSRLVILGEGTSETVVLPRVLAVEGISEDDASISTVPLGGRHVNHFWRLLNELQIPYVTLLDLDFGRKHGGYRRIKYVIDQLKKIEVIKETQHSEYLTKYCDNPDNTVSNEIIEILESHGVFFSTPIDLDMMMMKAYPNSYNIESDEKVEPDSDSVKSVLGKSATDTKGLSEDVCELFDAYRKRFKNKSKPGTHLDALAQISDSELKDKLPEPLKNMVDTINKMLMGLPE